MNASLPKVVTTTISRPLPMKRRREVERILSDGALIARFSELLVPLTPPLTVNGPFTIGVTGTLYDEGATSLAIGLAAVLAHVAAARVTIMDCDLGWPALHRRLEIPAVPGVGEIVAGRVARDEVLRPTTLPRLTAVAAGKRPQRGIESATRVGEWIARFKRDSDADYLILDLPPVNVDLGTQALVSFADAIFLVARGGATPRDELKIALTRLRDQRIAGVVLNHAQPDLPRWLTGLVNAIRGGG